MVGGSETETGMPPRRGGHRSSSHLGHQKWVKPRATPVPLDAKSDGGETSLTVVWPGDDRPPRTQSVRAGLHADWGCAAHLGSVPYGSGPQTWSGTREISRLNPSRQGSCVSSPPRGVSTARADIPAETRPPLVQVAAVMDSRRWACMSASSKRMRSAGPSATMLP